MNITKVFSSDISVFSGLSGHTVGTTLQEDSSTEGTMMDTSFSTRPEVLPKADALFGRTRELEELRASFRRVASEGAASEVFLIGGSSGAGKTSLVQHSLRNFVAQHGGFFVAAKFEQVRNSAPFPALTSVLSDLCDLALQDENNLEQLRGKIDTAISAGELDSLATLVSSVSQMTGRTNDPFRTENVESSSNMSQNFRRFKTACKLFLRAIASPLHPIVVFLDDLQWGDFESLDILRDLVSDNSQNLMLIGAYRTDESASVTVEEIFKFDDANVHLKTSRLLLTNLDEEATNHMVATLLDMPALLTVALSTVLFAKTDGNPFYLRELLSSLEYCGQLKYDTISSSWTWDVEEIQDRVKVTNNVLSVLVQKMHRLPTEIQILLTIAAYVGFTFRPELIIDFIVQQELGKNASETQIRAGVRRALKDATREGLIEQAGIRAFRFRHDKIQESALETVSRTEHLSLSCRLGWFLHSRVSAYGQDALFSAAYNLSEGLELVTDQSERVTVAKLNLTAGLEAKALSSFHSAAKYAAIGLKIIGMPLPWNNDYELTLKLCTLMVESKQCLGEINEVKHLISEILTNATSNLEKWPAYKASIEDAGTRGFMGEAINQCVETAQAFGDTFPNKPNPIHLLRRLVRVRRLLQNMTDADLLNLPQLTNEALLPIVEVQMRLQVYAFVTGDITRFALSVLRGLESSIKHGYSVVTPSSIATFGFLCSSFGNMESATRYAKLAVQMLDHWNLRRGRSRVYLVTDGLFLDAIQSAEECAMRLKQGVSDALSSGELEESFLNASLFSLFLFHSGTRLLEVKRNLDSLHDQYAVYDQYNVLFYKTFLAAAQNLMGLSDDPTVLTSHLVDEDEAIRAAGVVNDKFMIFCFESMKASLLFHFGYANTAKAFADKYRKVKHLSFQDNLNMFYFGLIYFEVFRQDGRKGKSLSLARQCLSAIRKVGSSNPNTEALVHLLEAEKYASLSPRSVTLDMLVSKYGLAISSASQRGFPQVEALANERASIMVRRFDRTLYCAYMQRAKELYFHWDAIAIFEYLEETDPELQTFL